MTIFSTEANTTNSAVLPVSYACAQPYYPGSGSDRQQEKPLTWGYAILMSLNENETAVHSRHCQVYLAVRMSKVTGNTKDMVVFGFSAEFSLKNMTLLLYPDSRHDPW